MSSPRRSTLARGTAVGVLSFALGYLLTWVLAGTRTASLVVQGPLGGAVPNWRAVLWVFYDSHFVGLRTPEVFGPGGGMRGGGEVVDTVGLLGVEYLYVVPVAVLLAAGALVASSVGAATARRGLEAGTTVGIGYLVAAVLGLFVASQSGVAPSTLRALVVAGVVYPVVLGAIGGAVAGYVGSDPVGRRGEPTA